MIVAGLLSGTSVDGVDVALADLSLAGDTITLRPLGAIEHAWPDDVRRRLLGLLPPATTTAAEVCELDTLVGQESAAAVSAAIAELAPEGADLVASLGQTAYHWVEGERTLGTLQLGQPAWIVEATGLPVVSDLRARDVAAGGHGAPLASTLDAWWLARDEGRAGALNLGGIANLTVVGAPGEPVIAFDTGPANCLLDATATRLTDGRLSSDLDGRLAAVGTVDDELLGQLLTEPYYALPAPKSTGRELFHQAYVEGHLARRGLEAADLMATLTELSAVTVADAARPYALDEIVVSGGGVRNPTLMAALRRRLEVPVVTSDERGLPAGDKEAYLVALLGFLSWHQLPGVLPGATGARTPRVLGRISPGDAPLDLPTRPEQPRRLVIAGRQE